MNYEQVKHYIKQFFLTLTEEERKILVLLFSLFEKNYVIQQVFGKEELCFSIFPENHSAKAIFPISFSKKNMDLIEKIEMIISTMKMEDLQYILSIFLMIEEYHLTLHLEKEANDCYQLRLY